MYKQDDIITMYIILPVNKNKYIICFLLWHIQSNAYILKSEIVLNAYKCQNKSFVYGIDGNLLFAYTGTF